MSDLEYSLDVFCVVCREQVPEDRKRRRATTCSKLCAQRRDKYLRAKTNAKKCRFCGHPCTPEDRASYRAWRKSMRQLAKTVVQ